MPRNAGVCDFDAVCFRLANPVTLALVAGGGGAAVGGPAHAGDPADPAGGDGDPDRRGGGGGGRRADHPGAAAAAHRVGRRKHSRGGYRTQAPTNMGFWGFFLFV